MTRFNWGWRIIVAFIIFTLGTSAWVAYAMSTEVELVRPDYYEYSLQQDATMASQQRAANSHASVVLQGQTFSISIPQNDAAGTVTLYRPNSPKSDRTIQLKLDEHGTMQIPTNDLQRGVWHVTVDWKSNGQTYELIKVFTLE